MSQTRGDTRNAWKIEMCINWGYACSSGFAIVMSVYRIRRVESFVLVHGIMHSDMHNYKNAEVKLAIHNKKFNELMTSAINLVF